jgi:hypothetical protein
LLFYFILFAWPGVGEKSSGSQGPEDPLFHFV